MLETPQTCEQMIKLCQQQLIGFQTLLQMVPETPPLDHVSTIKKETTLLESLKFQPLESPSKPFWA